MPFRSLQCGTLFLTFVHPVFSLLSWTSTILPLPSVPCQLRRSLRWIPDILHLHLRVLEPSQAQTPIFTARHGGWQFPKGNLELVLMLYRKRHHLGDYIHHFWAKKPDRTFLEFPPRSSRNSSHLSLLSSHSEQAHLKKPPPSPLAKSHGFLRWRNAFLQVLLVQISTKLQSHARSVRRDLCVVKLVGSPGSNWALWEGKWAKTTCMDFHIFQWIFDVVLRGFLLILVSDQRWGASKTV